MQIYSKVMKGIDKVDFAPACKGDVGDLVKKLLHRNPDERLPMKSGGFHNVKGHRFFQGFDWLGLENLSMQPPYVPVVRDFADVQNISAREEDAPKLADYVDDGSGWSAGFEEVPIWDLCQ